MDSTILKTQEKSLTDTQEKFLDALFGEARGNPKKAGELAGYSEHSYPKVLQSLKSEIVRLLMLASEWKQQNKSLIELVLLKKNKWI